MQQQPTTYTTMNSSTVEQLAALADAGDLDAIRSLVGQHRRTAGRRCAEPAPATSAIGEARRLIARDAARDLVDCTTIAAADRVAAGLRGKDLSAVAGLLGAHLHGTVAQRRRQLVDQTIGRVLTFGAVDGTGSDAALASWRRRMLAKLGETAPVG